MAATRSVFVRYRAMSPSSSFTATKGKLISLAVMANWQLVGAVGAPILGGRLSGFMISDATAAWYESLKRPWWRPPKLAFPLVWTSLYGGMGYASYMVWKEGGGFTGSNRLPLLMYGAQLAINYSWSPVFFGSGNLGGGFAIMCALDAAVAATGYLFYTVSPTAGYFFIPYMAWISLASCLNYYIWRNNPGHPPPAAIKAKKN